MCTFRASLRLRMASYPEMLRQGTTGTAGLSSKRRLGWVRVRAADQLALLAAWASGL